MEQFVSNVNSVCDLKKIAVDKPVHLWNSFVLTMISILVTGGGNDDAAKLYG